MNLLAKLGLFGLLVGGTASVLYADPVGGWLSPNGPNGVSGGAGTTGTGTTGSVQVGAPMTLSLADLQNRAKQLHGQIRADARHVQHLQQIARKQKDIIKLNCVNDKLVQIKPQMNLADSGRAELEGSTATTRMAIFDSISQAAENVRQLREEADQCSGEPVMQGGESSNSFTGPQAPDDPTKGFPGEPLEPPGYASPYN
jgi:hypothetical protein